MGRDIKLLVSDVDGTIVSSDKNLTQSTLAAVGRLREAGIGLTLISARPPSGVLPLAIAMGVTLPVGAFNGGTIVKPDGTVLASRQLSHEASRSAIALVRQSGADIWVFADGKWFASGAAHPNISRERRSSMLEPIIEADFEGLHGRIDKIVGVSLDGELVRQLEQEGKALLGPSAEISCSNSFYCDFTHPKANKGAGFLALAMAIGVRPEAAAAIGDMPNDIGMLQRAGTAVAMGQAPDSVKAVATWVTASNDQNGVALAIERILESTDA